MNKVGDARRFLEKPIIDLFLRIAILLSLFGSIVTGYQQNKLSHEQNRLAICQVNFNKMSNKVQEIRSDLAGKDRDALDMMIKTVATAKSRQQVSNALKTYIDTRNATDLERQRNPLPKINDFCG